MWALGNPHLEWQPQSGLEMSGTASNGFLYTPPLEAVSLIAFCSLLTVAQMRSTQHVDAARTMYPASRVFHSAGSGYKHVQSSTLVVGRPSRSLGTVRCTKPSSSAEADASVHVHTSAGSRKKRMNYNEHSGHWLYMSRQLSRQNCPATTARI